MESMISTRRNLLAPASATAVGGVNAIPELAPQWKKLELAKILELPAAYMSVSQSKSLYDEGGAQSAEKHRERGSLPATIKVVQAVRKAKNFVSVDWIEYTIFRESYPQSAFDKVQYGTWTSGLNWSPEKKKWDDELVEELQALVRPGDNEFNEMALQTAFVGTQLPLELSRNSIKVIVSAQLVATGLCGGRDACPGHTIVDESPHAPVAGYQLPSLRPSGRDRILRVGETTPRRGRADLGPATPSPNRCFPRSASPFFGTGPLRRCHSLSASL